MKQSQIDELKKELSDITKQQVKVTNQDNFLIDSQIPKWSKVHNVQGSILFVDIRNSTDMLTENGRKDMAKIYRMFAKIVETSMIDNEGKLEQLMGDGALCTFSGNKSGENAVSAALAINTYLENAYNCIVEEEWEIKCGFGIRTGHIFATRISFNGKESVVYPSTITSFACKFCNMAKGGQIIFDNPTKEQLGQNLLKDVQPLKTGLIDNCWCLSNKVWSISL
jgi:class 3 adenylate cyclase